jgi:hypothetical protein
MGRIVYAMDAVGVQHLNRRYCGHFYGDAVRRGTAEHYRSDYCRLLRLMQAIGVANGIVCRRSLVSRNLERVAGN